MLKAIVEKVAQQERQTNAVNINAQNNCGTSGAEGNANKCCQYPCWKQLWNKWRSREGKQLLRLLMRTNILISNA